MALVIHQCQGAPTSDGAPTAKGAPSAKAAPNSQGVSSLQTVCPAYPNCEQNLIAGRQALPQLGLPQPGFLTYKNQTLKL